jgi:TolA-binding protein
LLVHASELARREPAAKRICEQTGIISALIASGSCPPATGWTSSGSNKAARPHVKTSDDSSEQHEAAALEPRVAQLERRVAELQEIIVQLQKQLGTTAKPAENPLRSRGMMDRPKPGQ